MSLTPRDQRVADQPDRRPDINSEITLHALPGRGDSVSPTIGGDAPRGLPHAAALVHFPGYAILGELGRGGMGVVYKARQIKLNRSVALKVILAGPHASAEDKARFRVEAEAVARLRHPNIVQVYDVGEYEGFEYIALEFVDGETLRRWQNGKPVGARPAAQLAVGIGRAIQHAHENGILHRDIKPANILLAGDPQQSDSQNGRDNPSQTIPCLPTPKVTDFGLAKPMEGGLDLTITGMACGTPNYMAPELVRGKKPVGPAVDVYSFGAVLFEMLTGRPPYSGATGGEVMDLILRSDPPTVRRINPLVPRDLCVITEKCLEKDPARRYPTAAAAVEDLENYLAGRPIRARAAGPIDRAVRWCRRNPVAAAFLAATTIGCILTGTLAVALAESVAVERAARAEADRAGDRLREALAQSEADEAAALAAKADALAQKTQTDAEHRRAAANLRLARSAVRSTLEQLGNHPRVKEPDFRDFRTRLIRLAGDLRVRLAAHSGDDPDALADLAEFAHWTGFLEYLNGNMPAAADNYLAAADTNRRLAAVDPDDPAPLARRANALTNAANALYHAGRHGDAEARHREAVTVLEGLTARHPNREYHFQHVRAYAPLYELLREQGRWADGEAVCRQYLRRTRELARRFGEGPDTDVLLANALQCLGQMLDRTGKKDVGECYLVESLAVRDKIVAGTKGQPGFVVDAARGRMVLAEVLAKRGRADIALAHSARAAALAESAAKADPNTPRYAVAAAETGVALAEALRKGLNFKAAEPQFDRAIARMEAITKRPLDVVDARQARGVLIAGQVGRAHLLNNVNRHKDAVAAWSRLAADDPDPNARWGYRVNVLFSHAFDKNRAAAAEGADRLAAEELPPWICCDVAKLWCRLARLAEADADLVPAERVAEAERAFDKAVQLLDRAKAGGLFRDAKKVERFAIDQDFDPIRDRFRPN